MVQPHTVAYGCIRLHTPYGCTLPVARPSGCILDQYPLEGPRVAGDAEDLGGLATGGPVFFAIAGRHRRRRRSTRAQVLPWYLLYQEWAGGAWDYMPGGLRCRRPSELYSRRLPILRIPGRKIVGQRGCLRWGELPGVSARPGAQTGRAMSSGFGLRARFPARERPVGGLKGSQHLGRGLNWLRPIGRHLVLRGVRLGRATLRLYLGSVPLRGAQDRRRRGRLRRFGYWR